MEKSIVSNVKRMALPAVLMAAGMAGCGSRDAAPKAVAEQADDVLIQVADTCLHLSDVVGKIPAGLTEEDSLNLFNSIVDSWLQSQLINEIAGQYVGDIARIDRMTENYRRELILSEYRKHLKRSQPEDVPDDSVKSYFESHRADLTTEVPLVKGIYLKLPDYAAADGKVSGILSGAGRTNIKSLEKSLLRDAIQYDNFSDRWVDWQTIAAQIPYRFFDPDAFLESTRNFSTSYGGATYLLRITEYLPSGSEMPYDFAAPQIRRALSRQSDAEYERRVVEGLYRKALKEGKLKKVGYDPVARKMLK